jgi:hypothetical protein
VKGRRLRYLAAVMLLLAEPGLAQAPSARKAPPASTRVERPVPFKVGEALEFDVAWAPYLTAGVATVTVHDKRPSFDSIAYYIAGEGRPTGLLARLYSAYYKADTLLDVYTLLPQRGSVYSDEGGRHRMQATRFEQAKGKGTYEVTTATVVRKDLSVPSDTQDPLSALFFLRTLSLREGVKMSVPVVDSGTVYRVQIVIAGRETVQTSVGTRQAWKLTPLVFDLDGKPVDEQLAVWISDDAQRLPLRIDASLPVGRFSLVLREVRG